MTDVKAESNVFRNARPRSRVTMRGQLRVPQGRQMFARERQQQIYRLVEEHGRALVTELAERFDVSEQTVRKDLLALEQEGRLVRTHGGAIAVDRGRPELGFD